METSTIRVVVGGVALGFLFALCNHYVTSLYFSLTEEQVLTACSHKLDDFTGCLTDFYSAQDKQIMVGFINIVVILLCGTLVGLVATYKRPKQLVKVSILIALTALVFNGALISFEISFSLKLVLVALAAFLGCYLGSFLGNHLTKSGWSRPA